MFFIKHERWVKNGEVRRRLGKEKKKKKKLRKKERNKPQGVWKKPVGWRDR